MDFPSRPPVTNTTDPQDPNLPLWPARDPTSTIPFLESPGIYPYKGPYDSVFGIPRVPIVPPLESQRIPRIVSLWESPRIPN